MKTFLVSLKKAGLKDVQPIFMGLGILVMMALLQLE